MNTISKPLLHLCLLFLLIACKEVPEVILPENPTVKPLYELSSIVKIFGFDGQNRYAYCPSIVKLNNGMIHMYFCGNPEENIMVDNIYHIGINPDSTKTKEKSVLQPGSAGTWDDHHTCDPSIIEGNFSMSGTSYKYALFFLSNKYGVYYNEIGVAFSNDLDANSWVKYPNQVVQKTWITDGDQSLGNGNSSWGVGQPSAISIDQKGQVLLTYTIGDINGTRIVWAKIDMSNMDNFVTIAPTIMISPGLKQYDYSKPDYTSNSDFALDVPHNMIVIVRPVSPSPTSYPAFLNSDLEIDYMSWTNFQNSTGQWSQLIRINPSKTNYPRNHNAGFERNSFGYIDNWETPTVYYTVSRAYPDVDASTGKMAEWTYAIWRVKVQKNN